FDPNFSDPPLLQCPLLPADKAYCVESLCSCSFWCALLQKSACDQHCPGRGQGSCNLLEQNENSSCKL
ncbi:unnamed protein product, partial [Staurois parvus]